MKTDLPTSSAINRVFAAMFLFTGSNEGAERAILEGIATISPDGKTGCEELLLQASIAAAETLEQELLSPPQAGAGSATGFPEEMKRVLGLPRELRCCFVLRVLVAMPVEKCSTLLDLTTKRINANVGLAIKSLAAVDDVPTRSLFPVSTDISLWQAEFQLA